VIIGFAGNQYGSLVLGGYDQSKFAPTNVTVPFGSDVSRDLLVGVQSISTTASANPLTTGGFYAFIDSTTPYIWLPINVCQAFEAAFGITWDEDKELYLVNNTLHTALTNKNASVTLTLGASSSGGQTVDVTLPYSAFDLQASFPLTTNTTSYFPLKRAANQTQYTLGRTFLQEAYVIADYERRNFTVAPCAWVENAPSNIHTIFSRDAASPSSSSSSSGISGGAIAGIVIGVVAVIAILLVALWLLRRKRQTKKTRIAELEAKSAAVGPASAESTSPYEENAAKPFISAPIGGELGTAGEIHEMQGRPKSALPAEMETPYGTDASGYGYGRDPKDGMLGAGTWRNGISEVEGNNEQIYEMMGSDVHELPDSRRQSWADGEEDLKTRSAI